MRSRTRFFWPALTVLTVLFTLSAMVVAFADQLQADADALVASVPHANDLTANQQAGTTVAYDLSAQIVNTNPSTNDVFVNSGDQVNVSVTRAGDWLDASPGTPASFTFTAYDTPQAGTIRITVPCDAANNTSKDMTATLAATATNGKVLNPNSVILTYTITATTPADPSCTPSNTPPTVDAGGGLTGYSGNEGSPGVSLDGTVNDPDAGDTVTTTWSYSVDSGDAGTTCSFGDANAVDTTVTCTDNGTFTLTLTANDGVNSDVSDTASLTLSNVAPVISAVTPGSAASCGNASSFTVTFSDAGSNDTHTATVNWGDGNTTGPSAYTSGGSLTHTYALAGVYSVSVTITDDNGGTDSDTTSLTLNYNLSSILQPINDTRNGQVESLFKYGSTVPVKVEVTDCDGSHPSGLTLLVTWRQGLNATPAGVDEVVPTSQADLGNQMRFSDPLYVLQLNSKKTTTDPTCGITIWVTIQETGQSTSANIGFKK